MHSAWLITTLILAGDARAANPAIRSVIVPPELAAVTSNPEFSGIVWSQGWKRYLVVTDDSGLREKGTNHQPVVLGLSEDGILDKNPIPIRGIDQLNDPESICSGPNGSYFLVTSHSPNHANKTAANRRQLLQLREANHALEVIGRLDLTNIKGERSLLSLAGLPPEGRIDIEAVTYRDGALFIGFKSPLTDDEQAVVIRLADPLKAMRKGHIKANAITRFVAVPLCLEVRGNRVCQGISDMTFLADGSLVLSANAPKGGPMDHGGALWHLTAPIGKTLPIQLHRFPDLKPEGVTVSPSGHSLAVVFDCDQAQPKWTEVPLPTSPKYGGR
jgi:hypothetical protein